jgi:hypothetical protein
MENLTITPKQFEIVLLLYRFRFLNRTQVQKFLNHKDPRRINAWLKDLTEKNIIGRKYSRKLLDNTKPAIYHLATKSRKILLEQADTEEKILRRVYREKKRSRRLINHCLFLADIYFFLQTQSEDNSLKLHFFTKTDLAGHYYLPYNRPDAYIATENKEGRIKRYFMEIIDEGTPRFILRKRIEQYIEFFDSNKWQEKTGHPFPSILYICPNQTIKNFLDKHIGKELEEEIEVEIDFFLATKEDIEASQLKTNIWQRAGEEE